MGFHEVVFDASFSRFGVHRSIPYAIDSIGELGDDVKQIDDVNGRGKVMTTYRGISIIHVRNKYLSIFPFF